MTNADRIRAMTDEELAKVINAFTEYFDECNRSISEVNCEDCELFKVCSVGEGKALNWLQQPAEAQYSSAGKYTPKAIDIQWDVDEPSDRDALPQVVLLPAHIVREYNNGNDDAIGDYLSELTGFSHNGYAIADFPEEAI